MLNLMLCVEVGVLYPLNRGLELLLEHRAYRGYALLIAGIGRLTAAAGIQASLDVAQGSKDSNPGSGGLCARVDHVLNRKQYLTEKRASVGWHGGVGRPGPCRGGFYSP